MFDRQPIRASVKDSFKHRLWRGFTHWRSTIPLTQANNAQSFSLLCHNNEMSVEKLNRYQSIAPRMCTNFRNIFPIEVTAPLIFWYYLFLWLAFQRIVSLKLTICSGKFCKYLLKIFWHFICVTAILHNTFYLPAGWRCNLDSRSIVINELWVPIQYSLTNGRLREIWVRSAIISQLAKVMGPTWGPRESCRPQMAPCWSHEPCYQGWSCTSTNACIQCHLLIFSEITWLYTALYV